MTDGPLRGSMGPINQRSVLADEVYERAKAMILDSAIGPGEKLSIDWVAKELDVSQTPVREALARLESEKLLVKTHLRGYKVGELLNIKQFNDLWDFRLLIEPPSAAKAASLATEEDRLSLDSEMALFTTVPSGTDYASYRQVSDHDARFHRKLLTMADNALTLEAFDRSHIHLHVFRLSYGHKIASLAMHEHQNVVSAIHRRDAAGAETAMRTHLVNARARLLSVYGADSE